MMIENTEWNGNNDISKSEPQLENMSGFQSCRITGEARQVNRIDEKNVYVLSLRYHYDDWQVLNKGGSSKLGKTWIAYELSESCQTPKVPWIINALQLCFFQGINQKTCIFDRYYEYTERIKLHQARHPAQVLLILMGIEAFPKCIKDMETVTDSYPFKEQKKVIHSWWKSSIRRTWRNRIQNGPDRMTSLPVFLQKNHALNQYKIS